MRKTKLWLVLILAFSLVLTACGKNDTKIEDAPKEDVTEKVEEEVKDEKEEVKEEVPAETEEVESDDERSSDKLVYAITSSPEGKFNPLISNTQYDGYVNSLVYDSLLHMNDNLDIENGMAESYDVSEDSKKVTFVLKDNIFFHDGNPVTAEDVAFTFSSLAHPDYQGDLKSYVDSIEGFETYNNGEAETLSGIVVVDDKTVELNFEEPYSPVLINLGTLGILPKHVWSEVELSNWTEYSDASSSPIGSGPYVFKQYMSNEFVEFEGFDKYYDGQPKINKFIFKVVNESTAQAELIQKSVDVSDVSNIKKSESDQLEASDVTIKRFPNSKIQYMGFNLRDERLQDINLRTAMAYGIDRDAIVEGLLEGHGFVINTPMVPTLWSYPKDGLIEYKMDVDKATELLGEAGYADSDGDGIVDKDGENLKFVLTVPTGDKIREQTGAIIQENLKKIGIEIELEAMDFNAVMDKVVGNHEFDLYLMGNTLGADPDPTPNWYSTQASDEKGVFAWNIAGFRSEEADALMDENKKELDQGKRAEILQEFGKLLNTELPWVPLYAADTTKAYRSDLKGYSPNTFVEFYNVQNWELGN